MKRCKGSTRVPLNLVCSGPLDLLDKATQITMHPTKITTIVAAIGTTILRFAHSGSQGKNSFMKGVSLSGGAMVAEKSIGTNLCFANSFHGGRK